MNKESFAFYIAILRKYFVSYCTEKISDLGVTYSQLFVLIYISKKKECSSKEIVEYLKLDAGQLNRTLAKLLEKDLIIQRKNSNDRRFNILSLTKNGIKIVEESHKLFYSWDEQVLSDLDDDSRQELMNLMKKLVFNLNEKNGGKQNEQIK
ncbi:MAG TPA: MarR family transcriptional regulator [Candidatus Blautia stercoravium]|nr:MarR family transcriptional regulator [Candidatus Blautia stercoravium]